jgi:arginyl-tRNA synthetase
VFREADKAGLASPIGEGSSANSDAVDLTLLSAEEIELAKHAIGLPEIVAGAVESLEPHRIPFYLLDLAGEFHRYYNKTSNRIINPEDANLSQARLYLAKVIRDTIAGGLELLGVSAPDRM